MEEEEKYKLPLLDPNYITKNNLWDSIWLMKKYPDNHLNEINHSLGKLNVGRTDNEQEL